MPSISSSEFNVYTKDRNLIESCFHTGQGTPTRVLLQPRSVPSNFIFLLQESRYSKMEKADILEMTVKHLQAVQKQQVVMTTSTTMTTGQDMLNKYKAGFSECAQEIQTYLGQMTGVNPDVHSRLMQHLQKVSTAPRTGGMQHVIPTATPTATPLASLPGSSPYLVGVAQPVSVTVPPVVAVMSPPAATTTNVPLDNAIPLYISPRAASSPGSSAASPTLSTSPASSTSSRSNTPTDDVTHYSQTSLHCHHDVIRASPIVTDPSTSVWRPW